MKDSIIDKIMKNYFKYLGVANVIFYLVYLVSFTNLSIGLRNITFIIISSISMVVIPVLYLVIMAKKEKLKSTYMYMNIMIVTICFDLILLSVGKNFDFLYLIKSILISMFIFTPIRICISNVMGVLFNIPKSVISKNLSN